MIESLIANEALWRLVMFASVFTIFGITERLWPRRKKLVQDIKRWPSNLALTVVDTFIARLLLPIMAVGTAAFAETNAWGLLNQFGLSQLMSSLIAIIFLDLAIYGQHVLFHHVPVLWRLHRVHHSDTEFDITNGLRFHPIEIVLSMLLKMLLVLVIGAPVVAVIIFEILLNATAMFNHSNTCIPQKLDKIIRLFLVTPDFHRVHHSVYPAETNSNYGFNTPIWDRLFATYTAQPRDGHTQMRIGLQSLRDQKELRLDRLLMQPFRD